MPMDPRCFFVERDCRVEHGHGGGFSKIARHWPVALRSMVGVGPRPPLYKSRYKQNLYHAHRGKGETTCHLFRVGVVRPPAVSSASTCAY